jgi:hypothetical protein
MHARPANWLGWLALLSGVLDLAAQPIRGPVFPPGPRTYESRSLQFTIFGAPPGSALGPPSLSLIQPNHVQMDPTVLVLTCERVKGELLNLLGASDDWQGRILITVQGDAPARTPVNVQAQWSIGRWSYRLILPGQVERTRLVRALTRALLLEMANRGNETQRTAEVPLWLEEGFTTHLLAACGKDLIPEMRTATFEVRASYPDAFAEARETLRGQPPAPLAGLFALRSDEMPEADWEKFRHSSQLLVAELLNLPDGRRTMRAFLRQLPAYLNSQLAFERAFNAEFPSLLEAEKWWSVVWVNFAARERYMRLSLERSLGQLENILAAPIAVQRGTNAPTGRKELPLRELIAHTDFAQHQPAVVQALGQLQLLQHNAPVELTRLVGDYREALLTYLRRRTDFSAKSTSRSADAKLATKDALAKLDLLDVIRLDFARVEAALTTPAVAE